MKFDVNFAGHIEIEASTPEEAQELGWQILREAFPDYDNLPYKDYIVTSVRETESEDA
jgi:hypothetical protein